MYSRILFAVEDDEALPAAVPVVLAYARKSRATVRVLHVHRIDPSAPNGASRRLVKSVIERFESEGVVAEGEIRLMHRGEDLRAIITRAAKQADADLIAVGSHGRSDLSAMFHGSVSHSVAAGLDTPVLVVRASVTTSDEEARAIVGRALEALKERGVQATGQSVVSHSVVSALVSTAERIGADLVVLGSRRPSAMNGLLLGSVAHEAIHRLRCPVLLTRRIKAARPVV